MKAQEFYVEWKKSNNQFDLFALMEAYLKQENRRLKEEIEQLKAMNLKLRASL